MGRVSLPPKSVSHDPFNIKGTESWARRRSKKKLKKEKKKRKQKMPWINIARMNDCSVEPVFPTKSIFPYRMSE